MKYLKKVKGLIYYDVINKRYVRKVGKKYVPLKSYSVTKPLKSYYK